MDSRGPVGPGTSPIAIVGSLGEPDARPERRFDQFAQLARRLLCAPVATFELLDVERIWLKSRPGLAVESLPRAGSFCEEVVDAGGPLVVTGADRAGRFEAYRSSPDDPDWRCYAGVPVRGPSGEALGALAVLDTVARQLSTFEIDALVDLALMVEAELCAPPKDYIDELTGCFTRDAFERIGDWLLEFNSRRSVSSLVVCSEMDLHAAVLEEPAAALEPTVSAAATAAVLRSSLRGSDVLGRLGDGQIGALLINVTADTFPVIRDRIVAKGGAPGPIDGSVLAGPLVFGLAERGPGSIETIATLLDRAQSQVADQLMVFATGGGGLGAQSKAIGSAG